MSKEIVLSSRTAVERVPLGDEIDPAWWARLLDMQLIVVAPSLDIWKAYADEVGYKWKTSHHRVEPIQHGSQLVESRIIAPVVLVVGLPYDLDFRLSVIGALTEMQASWEQQGGRVIYVDNWTPPADLARAAGLAQQAERRAITVAEIDAAVSRGLA